MSILSTVVDIGGCTWWGSLFILNSYRISISPLLTALGAGWAGFCPGPAGYPGQLVQRYHHHFFPNRCGWGITLSPPREAGRVVDMNWRNTTIRTATGNMIIVPNKNIAASNVMNYEQPLAECTISIPITITYDNDLQKVEQVTLDVARYILKRSEVWGQRLRTSGAV